jgi:toxin secretion/phage lysis holin
MNDFKIALGLIGAFIAPYFGGWDRSLRALLLFFIVDYISGMIAAGRKGELCSRKGLEGIKRKAAMMLAVIFANILDGLAGGGVPVFRQAVIFACLGNEGLSIIENLGRCGVPIPETITRFISQLKDKSKGDGNDGVSNQR